MGIGESQDFWHGCQMFIHCISTQGNKSQFKDTPRRTGTGTLMLTFLQLLVSYFPRQTSKVIREIPSIGPAASLKANGTGQCHGIPVPFSFHWGRTAIPIMEPVEKYFTKYMNSCCNSFVYFPFLIKLPALLHSSCSICCELYNQILASLSFLTVCKAC